MESGCEGKVSWHPELMNAFIPLAKAMVLCWGSQQEWQNPARAGSAPAWLWTVGLKQKEPPPVQGLVISAIWIMLK